MRKKINVIAILLLVACLACMATACADRDANGLKKVKTPQNLALSGSALSWDEVEHAERYYISVNDEQKAETSSTTYDLSKIVTGYGNFSIRVKAYGDGTVYGDGDWSEAIIYHKGNALDTPVITVDKESKIASWQSVENAASYSVTVFNGKDNELDKLVTESTSYSFADKTDDDEEDIYGNYDKYRIVVVAMPAEDSEKYANSLMGIAYYYNSMTLSVPEFSNLNSSRLQWGSVTNAKSYTLKMTYKDASGVIEEKEVTTTGTSYQRSNFNYDKIGDYYFTIKANGDNEVYYDSAFSKEDETYKVTKLQGVIADDITLVYDNDGKARLTWSISADTVANQFYLSLKGLMPDGSSKLENSETSLTVSCKVVYVTGKVYDFYKYKSSDKSSVVKEDGKIVLYNMEGDLKVRYNNVDYNVFDTLGNELRYASYDKSEGVDIVYDEGKFVYNRNVSVDGGETVDQSTGEDEDLFGADGNRLCYFEEDSSDENVEKSVIFDSEHNAVKYAFAINLDDIFMKEVVEEDEETGEEKTVTEYKISDSSYYGILYNVSVSTGHTSNNYVAGAEAVTAGQYLSYKIPAKNNEGKYVINDAGEYAYIVLKNYIDQKNGVSAVNEYIINANINFKGYEIAQIETLKDKIDGNSKTLSNMVVGNKQLTEDGVVKVNESVGDNKVDIKYSMFLSIAKDAEIRNAFFMGIGFVGYEKEDVEEGVRNIYVAPITINNYGRLDRIFVQSDSIKADSAYVAGIAINNFGGISSSQVYADLSGRTVAGVAIYNKVGGESVAATVTDTGFYGNITAVVGEYISGEFTYIAGAGLVAENIGQSAIISNCEAIGSVSVTATELDSLYAGGLVAINSGSINKSFSGEYKRSDVSGRKNVVANGNNSYAGGFVALNDTDGVIQDAYATNRATANKYVGGFVGLNKGRIESAYALGGTTRGGNNGAFAGGNNGTIEKAAAYSSDAWAQSEDYFTLIRQESQLGSIIGILYPGEDKAMTMTEKEGFRYPVFTRKNYTKDYVVEMSPSQIPEIGGIAIVDGELKDLDIVEEDICGDRSKRGNKVVIVLNYKGSSTTGGNYVRLIYGKIR